MISHTLRGDLRNDRAPVLINEITARLPLCRKGNKLVVDLSDNCWVHPYGIVTLMAYLGAWTQAGGRYEIISPIDTNCQQYMLAVNFVQQVTVSGGTVVGMEGWDMNTSGSDRETVLPLTRIYDDDSVVTVSQQVGGRLSTMLGDGPPRLLELKRAVLGTVRELCQNIVHHADCGEGWICAQRYRNPSTGVRRVEIAIADAGQGMRASLSTAYAEFKRSRDIDAVRAALAGRTCFTKVSKGGNGLSVMKKAVRDHNGTFACRSGDGEVWHGKKSSDRQREFMSAWPGTVIRIALDCSAKESS